MSAFKQGRWRTLSGFRTQHEMQKMRMGNRNSILYDTFHASSYIHSNGKFDRLEGRQL